MSQEHPPNYDVEPPPVVVATLAPPSVREIKAVLDEQGRLAADVVCRSCGYNLRGLLIDGRCPECTTAIGRSVRGDLLMFCEPTWVDRLAKGMTWIIIGVFAQIAGTMVIAALEGIARGVGGAPASAILAVEMAISFSTAAVEMIGFWMVTTPDPGAVETERGLSVRRVARYALLANLLASPLEHLWNMSGAGLPGANQMTIGMTVSIVIVFLAILWLVALAGTVAIFVHARRLAMRVPHSSLAGQTSIVMWGTVTCQALGIPLGIMILVAMPKMVAVAPGSGPAFPPMLGVALGGTCILGLVGLVFAIWAIVLMFRYQGAFKRVAQSARATWAQAG